MGYQRRVTIAKCMVKGNLPMMGVGVNHDEATNVLKEEVEDYFSTLKEQEDTVDKEKDRQALIDMFVELVKIDQENAMDYFLTVGGVDIPENTRLQFTNLGKVQVLAIVVLDGYTITEVGSTRKESVNNLALKVRFFFFNYKYFHSTTVRNLMSIFPLHTTSTPFISSYYWNIKLLFNILRGVRHN